jgi:hypothetical protein
MYVCDDNDMNNMNEVVVPRIRICVRRQDPNTLQLIVLGCRLS